MKSSKEHKRLLWLSPNLNHYKARFLNHLVSDESVELTVLSGKGRLGKGDKSLNGNWHFNEIVVNVSKAKFGFSLEVREVLRQNFDRFDWILIPREKKNLPLIIYAAILRRKARKKGLSVKLISYNHPVLKSSGSRSTLIDKMLTRVFYKLYDRIVFYSEVSRNKCVNEGMILPNKAFWANNTIDTLEVKKNYEFAYPDPSHPTILFIGRLIPSKKINVCIEYYFALRRLFSNDGLSLKLIIIGDGPEAHWVKEAVNKDTSIEWYGALVDEKEISLFMKRTTIVFIPGLSGLSINHAFSYGRPFFTFEGLNHGPEIEFLKNEHNGILLGSSKEKNIEIIRKILMQRDKKIFDNAYESGKELSVENWKKQFLASLN
jgi:glycosyltransferase involved in cell wall biosynthesis